MNDVVTQFCTYDQRLAPVKWSVSAHCHDVFAAKTITIQPNTIELIPLWIKSRVCMRLYARSSLPMKVWLMLANWVWIIDADYRWEIMFAAYNFTKDPVTVEKYQKIWQLEVPNSREWISISFDNKTYMNWEFLCQTERWTWWFWSTWF